MTDAPNQRIGRPREHTPYVLNFGEADRVLVAGQAVHTLAGTEETAGGFGAVLLDATYDFQAIPLHYHDIEHDTWFCTRGQLQIWKGDQSRILSDGDFAYVKPGDVHSYRSVAPRTQFFGIVAPGGWEGFFEMAGEQWSKQGLPPKGHPYDFAKMGPAMGKYKIRRVEDASYAEASTFTDQDRELPAEFSSYFLQSGHGARALLNGHIATILIHRGLSDNMIDMRTIEGGQGATMPKISHAQTHVSLFVVSGTVKVTLNGQAHEVRENGFVNIPKGTSYQTEILSGQARWVSTAANGDGQEFWTLAGQNTHDFTFRNETDPAACAQAISTISDTDVVV